MKNKRAAQLLRLTAEECYIDGCKTFTIYRTLLELSRKRKSGYTLPATVLYQMFSGPKSHYRELDAEQYRDVVVLELLFCAEIVESGSF